MINDNKNGQDSFGHAIQKLDCYENVSSFLSLMSQGYKRFSSIFSGFTDLIC